jgi:hypothetical protein
MKLRTLGLVAGIILGAVSVYAKAESPTLVAHNGSETLRLFDKPCTDPEVVKDIREVEKQIGHSLLTAFKQGEYIEGKNPPEVVCYRRTIEPAGYVVVIFKDGNTAVVGLEDFSEEAI